MAAEATDEKRRGRCDYQTDARWDVEIGMGIAAEEMEWGVKDGRTLRLNRALSRPDILMS